MCASTRGTDEGKVEVGILQLRKVGENLVHEERDVIAIMVPINRITYIDQTVSRLCDELCSLAQGNHTGYVERAGVRHEQQPQRPLAGTQ